MCRQPAHFLRHQFPIRAPALHQTIRRAVLDDLAGLQHDHPVEIAQRRKTVGDRDHGAPAHQPAERLADRFLGFAVERGGGFVEQQDRRVLQEGARNRDALPLAARQLDAAVADHGGEAFRQGLDEIAARRDRRAQHLVVGGVRPAVADIFQDRAMEQRDILRHHRDRLAQALLRDPRDVLAVDGDAALLHVVEPLQQHEQGGLAAAGLADQSDPLARLQAKAELVEHLAARRDSGTKSC